MSSISTHQPVKTSRALAASSSWCVLSQTSQMGVERGENRLDHANSVLPTSIFAYAKPEVGT